MQVAPARYKLEVAINTLKPLAPSPDRRIIETQRNFIKFRTGRFLNFTCGFENRFWKFCARAEIFFWISDPDKIPQKSKLGVENANFGGHPPKIRIFWAGGPGGAPGGPKMTYFLSVFPNKT